MSQQTQPSIEDLRHDLGELLLKSHRHGSLADIAYQLFLQASDDDNELSHEQVKADIAKLNARISSALETISTEYQQLLDDSVNALEQMGESL